MVELIRNASPECLEAWRQENFDHVKMWSRVGGSSFPEIPPFPVAPDLQAPDMDESLNAVSPRGTSLLDSLTVAGKHAPREKLASEPQVPEMKLPVGSKKQVSQVKRSIRATRALACRYGPQGVPLFRSSLGWWPSLYTIPEDGNVDFISPATISPPCQGSPQKSTGNKTLIFSSI